MNKLVYGFAKQLPQINTLYLAPEQTHSSLISVFSSNKNQGSVIVPKVDGLIYQIKSHQPVCLSVKTADCLPILLFDQNKKVMAAVHMGYKGAYLGILDNLVKQLLTLNINLKQLRVRFGPSINGACYNIPMNRFEEFKHRFGSSNQFLFKAGSQYYLSLAAFAYDQLQQLGLSKHNFAWKNVCTHCQQQQYYSFRRGDRHHNQYSYLIYEA